MQAAQMLAAQVLAAQMLAAQMLAASRPDWHLGRHVGCTSRPPGRDPK
jgi:hypothetical protein